MTSRPMLSAMPARHANPALSIRMSRNGMRGGMEILPGQRAHIRAVGAIGDDVLPGSIVGKR